MWLVAVGCLLAGNGSRVVWTKKRSTKQQGAIAVDEIADVTVGVATPVLARYGAASRAHLYLSILTRFRSLDVECESAESRDDVAAALDFLRDHPDL